jgi:signal transduction histidine kinase
MLTSVEVALRQDRSQDEYHRVLEIVLRRGRQLRQIIEALLFLARADGATQLGQPEQIDLNDWCQKWLETWIEHPRASDIEFRASHEPAWTSTHPALLGQVLDNLLDNACKYSEPGTPIGVTIEAMNDHVGVVVSDAGCGIAADQQGLIFESFFRTTEARWQGKPGVGLGLAVVQRLAEILDARIEVLSQPGRGSSFTIRLRAYKEHALPTSAQVG